MHDLSTSYWYYNMDMNSLKEEAKKKSFGEFYYKILKIPMILTISLAHDNEKS